MRETRQSGLEGGVALRAIPTPIQMGVVQPSLRDSIGSVRNPALKRWAGIMISLRDGKSEVVRRADFGADDMPGIDSTLSALMRNFGNAFPG